MWVVKNYVNPSTICLQSPTPDFQIVLAARYKRLSFMYDGTFATLGVSEPQGPLKIDLEIKQRIFDFKLNYMVLSHFDFGEDEVLKGWSLELGLGGKYWKNDVTIDYAIVINDTPILEDRINQPQEWWDLMVGVKPKFIISDRFLLSAALNVGGFGIGNSSKFSIDFTYLNSFRVSNLILINAGFRSFQYKRVDGEGEDQLETKVNVLGPLLGISIAL